MSLGEYLGAGSGTTKLLLHLNGNSTDSSGNGSNGTDTAITYSQANGKFGQGAGFNGSTSLINFGDVVPLSGDITCSAWINATALSSDMAIVARSNGTPSFPQNYFLQTNNTGKVKFGSSVDSYIRATGATTLSTGTWYHVVGTFNSTTKVYNVYVNGKLDGTTTGTNLPPTTSQVVQVGASDGASPGNKFNGKIDEAIIENTTWTPQQVQKYYTNAKGRFGII